jgi:hypothetical protein
MGVLSRLPWRCPPPGSHADERDFHFRLMVVFTPVDVLLSSNQRVVTVLVCV